MTCPYCGSTSVDAEFVDVGVGGRGMQVTPWTCEDCWAQQMNPYAQDHNARGTEEERKLGWFRGPKCWKCLDSDMAWIPGTEDPSLGHHEPCDHPADAQNNISRVLN